MSIADLEKEILKIIYYFDIFNYPLIKGEIYRWLFRQRLTPEYLKNSLKNSEFLKNRINQKDGFYFLKGKEEIIKTRRERRGIAQRKILKAKKICKWLLFFNPFVKGIAICNDLAYSNAPEESDIDFFVITQKNRIWIARFFLALPLKLFGLRPTKKNKPSFLPADLSAKALASVEASAKAGADVFSSAFQTTENNSEDKKDKICLSFFISEDNLNLEKIMLEEKEGAPDIYFIYWLAQLLPIYGENKIWQNFYQANDWLKNYLPNFIFNYVNIEIESSKIFIKTRKFILWIHSCLINIFSEKFYQWIQLKFLPQELKDKANQNLGVIINDKMLKFHNPDKRDNYRQKWVDKMNGII